MTQDKDKGDNKALGAIFLTVLIDLVGFSIIFPLIPAILQWYVPENADGSLIGKVEHMLQSLSPACAGGDNKVITLVLFGGVIGSLFSLLQFVSSPIWGRLSDRMGRRRLMLASTALNCGGYILWFFSGNIWLFALSRLTCGLMAGNISIASAAVADVTSRTKRTRGMAVIGIAFATGFMIGPVIGGLASMIDIPAMLPSLTRIGVNPFSGAALVSIILTFCNLVWIYLFLPETLHENMRSKVSVSFNPLKNFSVDTGPVRIITWINFCFLMAFSGMEFTLTFLALERLGYGPKDNIWIFICGGLVMTLVQGVFMRSRLVKIIDEKTIATTGLLCGIAGMCTLALTSIEPLFYAGIVLKSIGIAFFAPTIMSLVSLYTAPEQQGKSMGTLRAAGALARAVGPSFAAVLYWSFGAKATYLLGAITLIVPIYMCLKLPRVEHE